MVREARIDAISAGMFGLRTSPRVEPVEALTAVTGVAAS